MLPRIYITDFITDDLAVERGRLDGLAEVRAIGALNEDQLNGRIEDATCLMVYHYLSIRAATIRRLKNCKLIVRCGVGIDAVDVRAAREQGITVVNVPDYGTEDVADSAIGMMMTLTRAIHLLNSRSRAGQGKWTYEQAAPLYRLRGRTVGVVGMGRIGAAVAHRAKAFGMKVIFYDPYIPDGWERAHAVERASSLDDLLPRSHVLSLHCPATPETTRLIGARELQLMPRGSFLINTSRGVVVDTAAVPPAIRFGQLAGAALDVLPVEPPSSEDALIKAWRDPNDPCYERLIITPHAAFYSEEGLMDIRVKASEACRALLLGEPVRNVVN